MKTLLAKCKHRRKSRISLCKTAPDKIFVLWSLTLLNDKGGWHKGSVHHRKLVGIQDGVESVLRGLWGMTIFIIFELTFHCDKKSNLMSI